MGDVGPIEDRDAALIPPLHHHFSAGDGDERAVVCDTILDRGLCRWHLVVALEMHLAPFDGEERIGTPLVLVRRTAAWRRTATPLVGEEDLRAIVAECRGMPERVVRVSGGVDADGVGNVTDVEQQAVAAAGTAGEADGRIHRDVVARRWTLANRWTPATAATATSGLCDVRSRPTATATRVRRFSAVLRNARGCARRRRQIFEDVWRAHERRLARISERHLDDFDAEVR